MKRILGLILVSMMLMTMILPVSAEGAIDAVTRSSLLTVPSNDATLIDNLNLDVEGVTFTSSDSAVINPATGVVTRPEQTKSVILTASAGSETKEFAFRVPGKFEAVGEGKAIPQSVKGIWSSDFAGTEIDATHVNPGTVGTVAQDGKLSISGGGVNANIYPGGEGNSLTGKFVIEYTLKRPTASGGFKMYFFGDGGRYLEYGSGGGAIAIEGAETTSISAWKDLGGVHLLDSGVTKTTIYFDTTTQTYDLWLNNILADSGSTQGATSVSSILIQTNAAWASTDITIDDFKAYYTEKPPVQPVTFYQDSFDGEAVPATIKSGTAVKGTGVITPSQNFEIALNESLTDIDGQVNLDFTISRPASGSSMDILVKDASGKQYVKLLWWGPGGSGALASTYSTTANADGSGSGWTAVGGDSQTTLAVKMTIDTKTKAITLTANNVAIITNGYALDAVETGVAGLYLSNYEASNRGSLADINCYGVGNYDLAVTHWRDTFDGTTLPTDRIYTTNSGDNRVEKLDTTNERIDMGVLPVGFNLKEDGSSIAQDATLEFSIVNSPYFTCSFNILDANDVSLADFVWYSDAGNGLRCNYWPTKDAESKTYQKMFDPSTKVNVKIDYNHTTKAVTITANNGGTTSSTITAYAPANFAGIAKVSFYDNDYGKKSFPAHDYFSLNDINCYSVIPNGGGVSGDVGEEEVVTKPSVSALALDYNPADKKVTILSPAAEDLTVIAAAYAVDGANKTLISAIPADVTLVEDGSVVADTSKLSVKGANSVIIYLWSDMDGLQPLYAVYPVSGIISAN